jgi:hypothetical protein
MKNFIGHDGFIWWIGIVEDINDPLTLGRCKVRCFGYHPAKKMNLVPTEDLPWALAIHPLNTPNLYGAPKLGDWVFGFFLDSMSAQEPAILGYLPAIPEQALEYFGTESSTIRNFATVTNRSDIVWQTANSNITIETDKNLVLNAKNSTINSNVDLTLTGNNVTISSNTDLTLRDSLYDTTLTELILRIETIEERLDNPTTATVPNTAITVITDI